MNLNIFLFICTTFACFASNIASHESEQNVRNLSDAEIAILGLSPPSDPSVRAQVDNDGEPALKPLESHTSSFITYDGNEEIESIASEKPFTITFPISRSSRNRQSVQSIVIPLPSNLNDKTGIIVIEDTDEGGNLDRRTLRAQFFSPTRIKPFRSQPLREETNVKNDSESAVNQIQVSNKRLQTNNRLTKKIETETKPESSSTSSVVFDDEVLTVTSTFSPESVFRPKSTLSSANKKHTKVLKSSPINDTVTITMKAKQRVNKKSKSLVKSTPKATPKITTTTTTTTTTTEAPTTTEEFEEEFEDTENTESTTITTPETTTRNDILKQLMSLNERPNIRRKWIANQITTTLRPTTERPTTTAPTTTTEYTTTQRITTQRPTTERTTTHRRVVPQRITPQRRRPTSTTTTTTVSPTITTTKLWETTTATPIETTESDFEFITIEKLPKNNNFDRNSLKLVKPKNKTENRSQAETILKPRPPSAPKIPSLGSGFLPSGKAFNAPHNVPGSAGVDYPTYARVPVTTFDCKDQMYAGFYGDMEAGCQVYHSCNGNLRGSKHTFLCPNGTIFSQEYLICDWWYNVNCNDSPIYYPLNKEAFSSTIKTTPKTNVTKIKNNVNKKNKPKTTTTEFVIRTITSTDLP